MMNSSRSGRKGARPPPATWVEEAGPTDVVRTKGDGQQSAIRRGTVPHISWQNERLGGGSTEAGRRDRHIHRDPGTLPGPPGSCACAGPGLGSGSFSSLDVVSSRQVRVAQQHEEALSGGISSSHVPPYRITWCEPVVPRTVPSRCSRRCRPGLGDTGQHRTTINKGQDGERARQGLTSFES